MEIHARKHEIKHVCYAMHCSVIKAPIAVLMHALYPRLYQIILKAHYALEHTITIQNHRTMSFYSGKMLIVVH